MILPNECSECFKKIEDFLSRDCYMINDFIWESLGFSLNSVCWNCLVEAMNFRLNRNPSKEDFTQYEFTPINLRNPEVSNLYRRSIC